MKFHALIEVEGVRSKRAALNVLQVMLNDYEDMNTDSKDISISLLDECKE